MKRYCSECGKMKECDTVGHCDPCHLKLKARKEELKKEGFYKNLNKLKQPRYFNFTKGEE